MPEMVIPTIPMPSDRKLSRLVSHSMLLASVVLMAITLYLVFIWVPPAVGINASRVFYFHVPLAWLGMVSIVIVAIASGVHLFTSKEKWDCFAYATAELGVLFITLLLVTGMVWNKANWGVWWTWEPRLTTTLILWFIFVGYLMLRAYGPKGSQGARYGAVVALIGAIDTPVIYMATVWWRTVHPTINVGPLANEDAFVDSRMELTLMISLLALTILYIYMLTERYSLRWSEATVDEIYRTIT